MRLRRSLLALLRRPPGGPAACDILAHDADWQYPAITEEHAFRRMRESYPLRRQDGARPLSGALSKTAYLGFPFATLFDLTTHGGPRNARRSALHASLGQLGQQLAGHDRVISVTQHIAAPAFAPLFAAAGVTDLFWSHASATEIPLTEPHFASLPGLRLHPFPLYPVQQVPRGPEDIGRPRRWLFSFVGAQARPIYLTQSRDMILDLLSGHPQGCVIAQDIWHYNSIVYDRQIRQQARPGAEAASAARAQAFQAVMDQSVFTLCPSGTGPNSLRLWEALLNGSIPVILSEGWTPPGEAATWARATVRCAETAAAIAALPDRLAALAADPARLAQMRRALVGLAARYGPGDFVADIRRLVEGAP